MLPKSSNFAYIPFVDRKKLNDMRLKTFSTMLQREVSRNYYIITKEY